MDAGDDDLVVAVPAPGPVNVADLVRLNADRRPDAEAMVQPGEDRRTLDWAELEQLVDRVAAGLVHRGLVGGQRLALVGPNSWAYVVGYLAALRAGLVVVPIDPGADADEVRQIVEDCRIRTALASSPPRPTTAGITAGIWAEIWAGIGAGVEVLPLSDDGLRELADSGHSAVVSPPDPEAIAGLFRTAGTSGDPKLVMMSHRALLAHVRHAEAFGLTGPDATVLGVLPLSHVFGLNAVLGNWLGGGARLVVVPDSEEDLVEVIRSEWVSDLPATPSLLWRLLADDRVSASSGAIGTLRTVMSAAAPLPWRLAQDFTARTGLRVERGYGLTEAAPGVSATFGHEILGPAHVGRAVPGVEIRIGHGTEESEPGPIWIRGDNLFSGYWPDGSGGPDVDGWFGTDDIGYLIGPELFLVDRARELAAVNGFTVYPSEVEQAIRELAEVRAVAVVGRPDTHTGARLVAFVAGEDVTEQLVREHCARRLAAFKRPAEVRVVDDLPRGVTGEVRRAALRRLLDEDRVG